MEKNSNEGMFDNLLTKYNALWLWSIEFGALSGTIFSLLTYNSISDGRWGPLNILFVVLLGLATISALISGMHLYRCLARYLLPKLLEGKEVLPTDFSLNLRSAFIYIIVAMGARFVMSISELVIRGLSY